jgi:hypothetical protein
VTNHTANNTNVSANPGFTLGDNALVIMLIVGVFIVIAAIVVVYFKLD